MNALEFFLKANLYLVLFYACYYLGLRRHTFFGLNRAYLLVSVVAALTLPLVELSMQTVEQLPVPVGVITLPVTALAAAAEPTGPDWETIGYGAYGLVAAGLLLRFLLRLTGLARLIARSERVPQNGFTLVRPESEKVPSFSFFRYLVLNPEDARHHADVVCRHELVHIRQWHSADVLFFELVQIAFWLNPVLLLYQRAIRQVHEFLADRGATAAKDSTQYATFLVEYAFSGGPDTLTNPFFNPSLLKERIQMLHRRATSRWAVWKYGLVLPLALGLLAMTSAPEKVQKLVSSISAEDITVAGRVTNSDGKPLAGANVVVVGTTRGTTTDAQGKFQLVKVPSNGKLAVSYVGFESQSVSVQPTLSIRLNRQPVALERVVVVSYLPKADSDQKEKSPSPKPDTEEVFKVVEQQPEFPGGQPALMEYLARNVRYPTRARQANVTGIVLVEFVVSEAGRVQDVKIMKGIGFGCDAEAARVVGEMNQLPPWQPGKQSGKPVAVSYVLPIAFELEGATDKRSGFNDTPKLPENLPLGDFDNVRPADLQAQNIDKISSLPRQEEVVIDADTSIPGWTTDVLEIKGKGNINNQTASYFIDDKLLTKREFSGISAKTVFQRVVMKTEGKGEVRAYTTK